MFNPVSVIASAAKQSQDRHGATRLAMTAPVFAMTKRVVLAAALLSAGAAQAGTSGWGSASDLLAVGLPAIAAGTTWAKKDQQGVKELALTLGTALAATEVLKSTVHEWRPDHSDQKSFPSGHTAIAFAAATYMDTRYGEEFGAWRPALYGAAALTAVARVQANKHHWKDVIAGGALGWASAKLWTHPVAGGQMALLPTQGGMAVAWSKPLQ